MTLRVTREGWQARLATGALNVIGPTVAGCTIHWEGPRMGVFDHDLCVGKVRGIQRFHQVIRGWSDIAYNEIICPHGVRFEGRGYGVGSAANGTTAANRSHYAICVMVGKGDPVAPEVLIAVADAVADYRTAGKAGGDVNAHRDWISTECPGDFLAAEVRKGTFNEGVPARAVVVKPVSRYRRPAPPPRPSTRPAPGPRYAFPLPGGFYFGKDDGTNTSVSGAYGRVFKGAKDSLWIWRFADQLRKRGWSVGKGKAYLTRWGNDGRFGDEYVELVKAFQKDQGLLQDGKVGPLTWAAAFNNPVT